MDTDIATIDALRADTLGAWLPHALADLLSAIAGAFGGAAPARADVLASWGLGRLAGQYREAETEAALKGFFGHGD